MNRIAIYSWSISLGVVGLFVGLFLAGSTHDYENWQVGMAGFISATAFCIPTALMVSRVSRSLPRYGAALLAAVGVILLSGIQYAFWSGL
jgi:hypothetical protein